MPRTYVDNATNRNLGRVGMPHGSAVHSSSSSGGSRSLSNSSSSMNYSLNSSRTYVDNSMNRSLGRVDKPLGTAVHSRSSTDSYSSSSSGYSQVSPKTYVDNAQNRSLGRVGLEYGTAVHSSRSPDSSNDSGYSGASKTYVDNPLNRSLDRVGKSHGSAVQSRSDGHSSSDSSTTTKVYVDNPLNQSLDRVGKPHGSAVHSRSDSNSSSSSRSKDLTSPKSCLDKPRVGGVGQTAEPDDNSGASSISRSSVGLDSIKTYVDNPLNRKLNRVGLPIGTAVYSRGSTSVSSRVSPPVTQPKQEFDGATTRVSPPVTQPKQEFDGASTSCGDIKFYKDNAFNRRHNRVGLPLGSKPISRKKPDRVDKPCESQPKRKNKLPQLLIRLETNFDDDLPEDLADMPEDDINTVCEFNNREQEFQRFLAERSDSTWAAHKHTPVEMIRNYKGNVINWTDLDIGQQIGHGGFGDVYFAFLDGQAVAVKKLKAQNITKKRLNEFIAEMEVYVKLDHPNIVSFLGACTEVASLAIVMEYMDMSLYDALHIKEVDFYPSEKLDIVRGVTKGLAYLHQQNIAHCDMKTQNVLLINVRGEHLYQEDQPVLAKITDFGLSKMKSDTETSTSRLTRNQGTPRYAAPENQRGELLTPSQLQLADIFSLGLLIWELAVQEIPFEDLTPQQLRVQVGEKGLVPETPSRLRLNEDLQETLTQMWRMNPAKRPAAASLAAEAETWSTMVKQDEE